jgi:broad specificity phosphatase PhoE
MSTLLLNSTITILRHGQPEDQHNPSTNTPPIFRGATDDPLSSVGWSQMNTAIEHLKNRDIAINSIITSPLKRCVKFAQQLSQQQAIPLETIDALKEINFGQWDGVSVQLIAEKYPQHLHLFWQDPMNHPPPEGELLGHFQQRILNVWQQLLIRQKGKHCLLISHGGVQKIILAEVLNMPIQAIHNIEIPYACCSTFQIYHDNNPPLVTLKLHHPIPLN